MEYVGFTLRLCMECGLVVLVNSFAEEKTRWFLAVLHMLKWFAGHQIRNVGVRVRLNNLFVVNKVRTFATLLSKGKITLLSVHEYTWVFPGAV